MSVQQQSLTLKAGWFLWGQILGQVVRAVATASPVHSETKGVQERLLLHISSSPRRLSIYLTYCGVYTCQGALNDMFFQYQCKQEITSSIL